MSEFHSNLFNRQIQLIVTCLLVLYFHCGSAAITILYFWLMFYGNIFARSLCLLYGLFYLYDFKTPSKGGRGVGCEWFRNLTIWKHFIDYFPIDLVKTADLPADQNYLLAVFPHGLLSIGAFGNCFTNHSKWRSLFPGIRAKGTTISLLMNLPIFREVILSWGGSNVNVKSVKALLMQSNDPIDKSNGDGFTSNGTVLVVGGIKESFLSSPNKYKIILGKRRGFVRLALECGAPIVPVISFGEVNVYDSIENDRESILQKLEEFFWKYTTFAALFYNIRIFCQNKWVWIPKREPITMVVGAPIKTTKTPNPTDADINAMHQLFSKRLNELFEDHKSKYVENHENVFLEME